MTPHGKLAALILCAALSSCALFESDPPKLIGPGMETKVKDPREAPAHFVVTVNEARLAVPISKYLWSIYADSNNYYLYPSIGTPKLRNSATIREYGYPLSGTTRHDIDRIIALGKKNRAAGHQRGLSISQLEQTLPRKHKDTPTTTP